MRRISYPLWLRGDVVAAREGVWVGCGWGFECVVCTLASFLVGTTKNCTYKMRQES